MTDIKNLLLLFDRPKEPVFMVKGNNQVFDVPENFLTDRYKGLSQEIQTRFSDQADLHIPVRKIAMPDLRVPMSLGVQEQFSLFLPKHRKIAGRLIDIFIGLRNVEDLQSVAVYCRDRVNSILFNYALSVALLHRPDTKNLDIPPIIELFPDKFIDSKVISNIREETSVVSSELRKPILIPIDYTASDLDEEHRLWYFREDMGVNLHHWHWHLVYPAEGDRRIVAKDRRGELFYYMHQQIIARYNYERFSNRLTRVKRLNNLREPLKEGYFPKMDSIVASRAYPGRMENTLLRDIHRDQDDSRFDVEDLERWRDRTLEAISQGFVVDTDGNRIILDEIRGIDILGNIIESSSVLSPNAQLYGNLHNFGHVLISFAHDPDARHLEPFGVIGDVTTAMRDPAFYRWHGFIDDMFQAHKNKLTPYTRNQLNFNGINLVSVQVQPEHGDLNTFHTFWQQSDVDLNKGMDFVPRGNIRVRFTHLQHSPFSYTFQTQNETAQEKLGYVRIFLGPNNDERNQLMSFKDQRLFMIELDKFIVQLRPGNNIFRRKSVDSTVTIPFERTFRPLDKNPNADDEQFNFCNCGWPHHLLIPKGLAEGLSSTLFVMISDYEEDKVDQDLVGICNDAASYCGVRDRLYPDKKSMGYPFDRLPRNGVRTFEQFLTPNMIKQDVDIIHSTTKIV